MFKNGECYDLVARQGAGAYLAGTTTANPRRGNEKEGIYLPFVPYRNSRSASNWLGLPNDGDEVVAKRLREIEKVDGCPVGISVMGSPDLEGKEKLEGLVRGMRLYDEANVDFIEMNESCPNTENGKPQEGDLSNRLKYIKENFLDRRERNLPVIVKFSNDTVSNQVHGLMDLLFECGFDGVNFGNTSTNYKENRIHIKDNDKKLYDFFTSTFGGGVSGRPLKDTSESLARIAREYLEYRGIKKEFHIIRTGGITGPEDLVISRVYKISLNQWFTGYFESFAEHGHDVYKHLYENANMEYLIKNRLI